MYRRLVSPTGLSPNWCFLLYSAVTAGNLFLHLYIVILSTWKCLLLVAFVSSIVFHIVDKSSDGACHMHT